MLPSIHGFTESLSTMHIPIQRYIVNSYKTVFFLKFKIIQRPTASEKIRNEIEKVLLRYCLCQQEFGINEADEMKV